MVTHSKSIAHWTMFTVEGALVRRLSLCYSVIAIHVLDKQ